MGPIQTDVAFGRPTLILESDPNKPGNTTRALRTSAQCHTPENDAYESAVGRWPLVFTDFFGLTAAIELEE